MTWRNDMEILIFLGSGIIIVVAIFKLKGYLVSILGIILVYFIIFEPKTIEFINIDKGFVFISAIMLIVGGFIIASIDSVQKKIKTLNLKQNIEHQNTDKKSMPMGSVVKIIALIISIFIILPFFLIGNTFYSSSPLFGSIFLIVLVIIVVLLILIIKRIKNDNQKNVFQFIIEEIKKMLKNKNET
jgi:4-hydroxybenzoate polyprenyltransferase